MVYTAAVNGYGQGIEDDTHLEALGPVAVEVCLTTEGLPYLQRADLGLSLVFVVGALLAGLLSELVLVDHD